MTPVAHPHALVRDTIIVPDTNNKPRDNDRPEWIPDDVGDDWNPSLLAYQTEEESMPAGPVHNDYLHTIAEMLRPHLARLGLLLLIDVFLGYRKVNGAKNRIAPDGIIIPCAPSNVLTTLELKGGYDLDHYPVPPCLIEVISPSSFEKDLDTQYHLYERLGVFEYVVFNVVNKRGYALEQIEVFLWRLEQGRYVEVSPDEAVFLPVQSMQVRIRANGQRIVMLDMETGERLLTNTEWEITYGQAEKRVLEEAKKRKKEAEKRKKEAEKRKQAERQAQEAQQRIVAIARQLLPLFDDAAISEMSGLSVDEVRQLRKQG